MKTRIKDFLNTSTDPWSPVYSFQYSEAKRPAVGDWSYVSNGGHVQVWTTPELRDRARACFTTRRSAEAAIADLRAAGLLPNATTTENTP